MSVRPMVVAALGFALAACQPAEDSQYPQSEEPAAAPVDAGSGPAGPTLDPEVAADEPIHDAVLASANAALSHHIAAPAVLDPEIFRSEGEWAFVYGPVRAPDGGTLDWSTTAMAEALAEGMMDGDLGVVLLNWRDGEWQAIEVAVGATDVPQAGWPEAHGVSPALVGMEGG